MHRIAWLVATALWIASPGAAQDCRLPSDARGARPSAEAGPTEILIGMFLLDAVRVDDRDQSITLDFNVNLRWRDPRLARSDDTPPICTVNPNDVWTPNLRIVNQRRLNGVLPEVLRIDRDGLVHYDQRFFGELRSLGDFHDFPFDHRDLVLEVVAVDRAPEDIVWKRNDGRSGKSGRLAVANWKVGEQRFEPKLVEVLSGQPFQAVDFVFPMERRAQYFVWNTIVPLVMIVFMSWCVFFVNPTHLGAQLGLAATSMLSLIAYRFTLGGVLPPVPYFTRMDVFLTGASLLVFLALAEAVTTSTIADNGNPTLAARIDRFSRYAFPGAFGLILLAAFAL